MGKLITLQKEIIFSIYPTPRGEILLGTGNEGKIYSFYYNREKKLIADISSSQVLDMISVPDGILVSTGDDGKLFLLDPYLADTGVFITNPLDAGYRAAWGNIDTVAIVPGKSRLDFYSRSGQVSKPDTTWSTWQPVVDRIQSPAGRYMQFKILFERSEGTPSPVLSSFSAAYLTDNRPPRIANVMINNISKSSGSKNPVMSIPFMQNQNKAKQKNPKSNQSRKMKNSTPTSNPPSNLISFSWSATDPDRDKLVYTLSVESFEKQGKSTYFQLVGNYNQTSFKWDASSIPDGYYRLTLTASDELDNPANTFFRVNKESERFVIDHTPPNVVVIEDPRGNILGRVDDSLSHIKEISYSLNGMHPDDMTPYEGVKIWKPLYSDDGMLGDENHETFRIDTKEFSYGTYLVSIMASDEKGNHGYGYVVIRVP